MTNKTNNVQNTILTSKEVSSIINISKTSQYGNDAYKISFAMMFKITKKTYIKQVKILLNKKLINKIKTNENIAHNPLYEIIATLPKDEIIKIVVKDSRGKKYRYETNFKKDVI